MEDDFSSDTSVNPEKVSDSDWKIKDGMLEQSSSFTDTNSFPTTGSAVYFGDDSWTNCTYTLEATKISGMEGFLIPFSVRDKDNNYFWNIGGWNNTVSCLQRVKDGVKSDQVSGTVSDCRITTGKTYSLKIVVSDANVKCYIDGQLKIDYNIPMTSESEAYEVTSTDETGDIIIKLVNEKSTAKTFAVDIKNAGELTGDADVEVVSAESITADNILGEPEAVTLKTETLSGITPQFNYTVPQYSVTVLRIHRQADNH